MFRPSRRPMLSNRWVWILGILAVIVFIVILVSYLIDEPLRGYIEGRMNAALKGYTVKIGALDFHPLGFSLDLRNLTVLQNKNPDPPVARIKEISASVHWRELLRAHLVADFRIDTPDIYLNLQNIRTEAKDKVPVDKRGWQDALQSIYPLKINVLAITHGTLTYIDEGPYKPLRITNIEFQAHNIRNISSPERVYPSTVHLHGTVFETGKLVIDGRANFLAKPHVTFSADFSLGTMELSYFSPIVNRYNMAVNNGTLSADGHIEIAKEQRIYNLKNLTILNAYIDYVHHPGTAQKEKEVAKKVGEKVEELPKKATTKVKIDTFKIEKSSFGYMNKAAKPEYRVFIDNLSVTLKNFSNKFLEGPGTLHLTGQFMGSGNTSVYGTFRPEESGPDFDLKVAIENTKMTAMNDLFRAYGKFDVVRGLFSFYAELGIKNNHIDGYIKPLFKDMKVYDRRQDKEKGIFRKLYEKIVGGLAKLLENPREDVATQTPVHGELGSPETSTWQIIINLIRNAFFHSILPGFAEEIK